MVIDYNLWVDFDINAVLEMKSYISSDVLGYYKSNGASKKCINELKDAIQQMHIEVENGTDYSTALRHFCEVEDKICLKYFHKHTVN